MRGGPATLPAVVAGIARANVYRLFIWLRPQRVQALGGHRMGKLAIAAAQRLVAGAPIAVRGGQTMGLRLSTDHVRVDHAHAAGLIHGGLEPGVQEALRRHVAPGSVVYDIGANLGFFTLLAARLAGPTGQVHAFEPSPQSAAGLRRHVELNHFAHAHVHEVAVGSRGGRAPFLVVDEQSWSHLEDRGWHPRTQSVVDVELVSIDELVAAGEVPPPDVVKIDVEGSEVAVLSGMAQTLRSTGAVVICELHETNAELLAVMDDLGYAVRNLDGPAPVLRAGAVHIIAWPTSRPEAEA